MIGIVKTSDKRFLYMSTYFKEGVIYSDKALDFKDIDTLILPIGGVDRFLFVKDSTINLNEILIVGDDPQQVKTKLRHWAQAVACSVIQSS